MDDLFGVNIKLVEGRIGFGPYLALERAADVYGDGSVRIGPDGDLQIHGDGRRNFQAATQTLAEEFHGASEKRPALRRSRGPDPVEIRFKDGLIRDTSDTLRKSGLRMIVERFRPELRFTSAGSVFLEGIPDRDRPTLATIVSAYGLDTGKEVPALTL